MIDRKKSNPGPAISNRVWNVLKTAAFEIRKRGWL
jgi:hypothetical protein